MLICVARYRRELRSQLRCVGKTRRALMQQFDTSLDSFLQDHPDTTAAELYAAFGDPEIMAQTIMSQVSQEEKDRFRRRRILATCIAALAVTALLVLTVYVFGIKQFSNIDVYDEVFEDTFPSEVTP